MADNDGKEETRQEEQQDLVHQQQGLFHELAQEQAEAEKAVEADQEQSAKAGPQDESEE